MRAVIVTPKMPGSGRLAQVPDPQPRDGEVLVQVHQVGLDGTDAEILQGQYGEAPPAPPAPMPTPPSTRASRSSSCR